MKKKQYFIIIVIFLLFLLVGCTMIEQPGVNPPEDPGTSGPGIDEPENPTPEVPSKAKNIKNFVSEENEVPKIIINTKDKVFPYNKEDYIKGNLKIVEQPNTENIIFEEATMGIRLRGNSTLDAPKKAFRIKFDEKQSLFGLEKSKSWVLLANYFDKSHMRNYLAYLTANKLDNLDFQPSSIFVEVEFNGEYLGLYLLCEQMQTGKGRVDIEQDDFDANPSYLMELDFLDRILADGLVKDESFFESNGLYFAFKYPEDEDATKERCKYIKEFVDNVFDSIRNKKDYESLIDVDSLIDYYLVNELFKNVDAVQTSVYFVFTDGMLKAGPVWDFDIALGVVGRNENSNMYEGYQNSKMWLKDNNPLYKLLFNDQKFVDKVIARYNEVRPLLAEVYSELLLAVEILDEEIERDVNKWGIPGELWPWIATQYSIEYRNMWSFKDHISFLKKQLNIQFINMDNEFQK